MATLPMSILSQKPAGATTPAAQFPNILTTADSAQSGRLMAGVSGSKKGDIKAKKMKVLKLKLGNIKKAKTLKKMNVKKAKESPIYKKL